MLVQKCFYPKMQTKEAWHEMINKMLTSGKFINNWGPYKVIADQLWKNNKCELTINAFKKGQKIFTKTSDNFIYIDLYWKKFIFDNYGAPK